MTPVSKTEELSRKQRIFQLIVDSTVDMHRPASREWLRQQTGYDPGVVDEQIKALRADLKIYSDTPGYYLANPELPEDRAISVTRQTNGMRKVEIGDLVLDLTPHEWAVLGDFTAGSAQRERNRDAERGALMDLQNQRELVKALRKQVAELVKRMERLSAGLSRDLGGSREPVLLSTSTEGA